MVDAVETNSRWGGRPAMKINHRMALVNLFGRREW